VLRTAFGVASAMILLLGCGGNRVKNSEVIWRPFDSPEGKFGIELPGDHRTTYSQQGDIAVTTLNVPFPDKDFSVSVGRLLAVDIDLLAPIRELAKAHNGNIVTTGKPGQRFYGHPGREFEIEVEKPRRGFASGRILIADGKIYQILAIGEAMQLSDPLVQRFLNSFTIAK